MVLRRWQSSLRLESAMLNQSFNPKPAQASGYRKSGMPVSNPRQILAIAMNNNQASNQALDSPLAQALSKKKKKRY